MKAKFGVAPGQIVDYLALVGDSVDNIPGVEKVGPKTAAKWIAQYGSLEGVLAHADEITGVVGENLRKARDWLRNGARARHREARRGAAVQGRRSRAARARPRGARRALPAVRLQELAEGRAGRPRSARRGRTGAGAGSCGGGRAAPLRDAADRSRRCAVARADRAGGGRLRRHRDHLARSVRGGAGRRLVRHRTGRGGLSRDRAPGSGRAGAARRRASGGAPPALARGRFEAEAGAEPQVRSARPCEPRRAPRGRRARHAAPVLRPGEQRAARHGRARRAVSRPEDDHLRRGDRQGRAADRVRAGRRAACDRVLGRGRRRHAAASPGAVSEARRGREAEAPLRDDRDAGARGAVPDGAHRRARRRGAARRPEPRARAEDDRARAEGVRRGRAAVQPQLAEADRRDLLRAPEAAGGQEDAERRAVDRRGRAREARARLSAAEDAARVPVGVEAQVHLHRQAAANGQREDRPGAHHLRPDDRGDRATRVERSKPPEHPGAHARGPSHPRGVRRSGGARDRVGRLLADRAAHHGASLAGPGLTRRFRARARTFTARPPPRSSAAAHRRLLRRSGATRRRSTSA